MRIRLELDLFLDMGDCWWLQIWCNCTFVERAASASSQKRPGGRRSGHKDGAGWLQVRGFYRICVSANAIEGPQVRNWTSRLGLAEAEGAVAEEVRRSRPTEAPSCTYKRGSWRSWGTADATHSPHLLFRRCNQVAAGAEIAGQ